MFSPASVDEPSHDLAAVVDPLGVRVSSPRDIDCVNE
jgi:hypothetical protein